MDAQHLVNSIATMRPQDSPEEHLRLALLLSLQNDDLQLLLDPKELERQCSEIAIQLSAATDQHAAVASELDSLATTSPCEFNPEHLWTLVRALKVQSQVLNMYLGPA